jgi:putative ABC transport system permease protein
MPLFDAVRLALTQLRVQKLKSFFTLAGVTIGVMFLIAVVSIVEGLNRYIEQDFAGKFLGVNTFNLRKYPDLQTGDVTEATWREWQRRPPITVQDADAVREALPADARWAIQDVRWVDAQSDLTRGGPQVIAQAVTVDYFAIKDLAVSKGRVFSAMEDALGAPVIVIGSEVASHYFPNLDPVGRTLKMDGLPFRVIGVLEKQGSALGFPFDQQVFGPFHSPMQRVTHARVTLYGVVVQAPNAAASDEVQNVVREVMRKRHKLRPDQPDDFVLETTASALSDWESLKRILVIAGIVLPAIGLVVGAIVIMNIMLVAVAERTREIGIRKSLGARRRDILAQFLVESATLSLVGSLIGIGLGIGISQGLSALFPLKATVAPWSVAVSVALGGGIGILAGTYPASRAARLDPIAALRSD